MCIYPHSSFLFFFITQKNTIFWFITNLLSVLSSKSFVTLLKVTGESQWESMCVDWLVLWCLCLLQLLNELLSLLPLLSLPSSNDLIEGRDGVEGRGREHLKGKKISPVNSIKNIHKAVLCPVINLSCVTVRDLHLNSCRGISNNFKNQTITVSNTWPVSG